ISTSKTVRQEDLIRQLNPILRGWAFYHQPVVAKQAYSRMDHMIFLAFWLYGVGRNGDTLRKRSSGSERNTLDP
ncbi:group II intron maturase-specific domain-containing protein, partial [Pseudomonas sp. F01002]|uniref:group II intron maturase-specific domain-containing protein n=1 Tax=Pseudomonas sp. F01002 TaxID=2555724 RepID=UPI00273DC4F9